MANKKINGITIRFGADYSPLDKALKEINSTSSSLNGELKQVNKLLKFDPGNTILLSQKQELLSKSIQNTETKLKGLKEAQSEVEKLFKSGDIGEKEYREFQRSIEETEQSLKSYQMQAIKMTEEHEKLQTSTKQLDTLLQATGKTLDDFQDVIGTRLTNAIKNGRANSDDLTVAINKIGKEALGAEADLGQMREALNKIDSGSGIDEIRESLRKLKDDSSGAEESLNDIGKGIAAGNLMEAGEQVSELGDKVIELGEKSVEVFQIMENATKKVSARFGETGAEAQTNADIIKTVFESGVGGTMDAVADAVILVRDNIKNLDNTTLENITSQGLILEEMYGISMEESLRGVNSLMNNFGMSATEAMDFLIAGTQGGLDKTNELGDNLSEYSGKFAQAGYSAQEYFQLLQNGLDGGAYNLDKVNDAINEVTTRLVDGTVADAIGIYSTKTQDLFTAWQNGGATQKEVIDSIVSDIAGCQNQQEQLNMAATAFGTMAEDGSAKFITSLTTIGDSYDDVTGKAAKFQEDTTTEEQKAEAAMRKLSDALIETGESIQEILIPILEAITPIIQDIASWFSGLSDTTKTIIVVIGGVAAAITALLPIISVVSMAITTAGGAMAFLTGTLLPVIGIITGVIAAIAAIIVAVKNWGAITDWLSEKWNSFKDWFTELWDTISNTIKTVWENIKTFFTDTWNAIYEIFEVPINLIKSIVEGTMYAIYAVIYTIWEVIKFALSAAWTYISTTAEAIFNPIAAFFSEIWNGISSVAIGVWNTIKDTLGGIWNTIKSSAMSVFGSLWSYIKSGFTSLRDTLSGIVSGIANGIITPIGNAINGVIKGVNWILGKVGSDKSFDLWAIPKFARGAAGLPEDTLGIVNDQKGAVYKELIVPPDGKPFIPEGRDVLLPMKKGTKIMPADETKNLLSVLPHFASGIGEFFGGLWETVSDFTGNIFDYIKNPGKIVQIAIDKFTDLSGIMEPWLSVTTGAINSVVGNITDFVKGIFDKEMTVNYSPSAGVEQWRSLAEKALRITGQYSAANLERLLYQMQTESGGNPNAINLWDSNAKAGIPSKGLMQVIDPTFRTYAMSGYNTNIYDPLSNMIASIRYAVSRYGSLASAYSGHGYEEGIGDINLAELFAIPTLDVRYFEEGGLLTKPRIFQTGTGVGVAGEGKQAEAIAPVQKLKDYIKESVLEVLNEKNINITVNMTGWMDGRQVAKGQVNYMQPMLEEKEKIINRLSGVR